MSVQTQVASEIESLAYRIGHVADDIKERDPRDTPEVSPRLAEALALLKRVIVLVDEAENFASCDQIKRESFQRIAMEADTPGPSLP